MTNTSALALINAAENGDEKKVLSLLLQKVSPNITTSSGETALMAAAKEGHIKIIKLLVQAGANIHKKTKMGFSAFSLAAAFGHIAVLSHLLELGADIESQTKRGTSALMLAAGKGQLQTVRWLLKHGANINLCNEDGAAALAYTLEVWEDNENILTEIIKILLEYGADCSLREKEANFTPLMIAVQNGFLDAVKLLVEYGADVNASSNWYEVDLSKMSAQEQIAYLEKQEDSQSHDLAEVIKKENKALNLHDIYLKQTVLNLASDPQIKAYLLAKGARK